MSATPKSPIIIQGEASESDDDTAPSAVQAVNKLRPPAPKEQVLLLLTASENLYFYLFGPDSSL